MDGDRAECFQNLKQHLTKQTNTESDVNYRSKFDFFVSFHQKREEVPTFHCVSASPLH
jgi:hypothetical protein